MKKQSKQSTATTTKVAETNSIAKTIVKAEDKTSNGGKKTKKIIDTPIVDVVIEKENLKPIKPKLNWFQRQYNSFVSWYNS